MAVILKKGKGSEWEVSIQDDKGLVVGLHYPSDRKVTKKQKDIIESALRNAVVKLEELNK
jgi:hypothetical protein